MFEKSAAAKSNYNIDIGNTHIIYKTGIVFRRNFLNLPSQKLKNKYADKKFEKKDMPVCSDRLGFHVSAPAIVQGKTRRIEENMV